jgi:hypothetical protein
MKTTGNGTRGRRTQVLSPLHTLNLQFLIAVRHALHADPVQAAHDYGLDAETAGIVADATDEGLRSLSYSLDRAVFTLRLSGPQLFEILNRPESLRPVFAAARNASRTRRSPETEQ